MVVNVNTAKGATLFTCPKILLRNNYLIEIFYMRVLHSLSKEIIGLKVMLEKLSATGSTWRLGTPTRANKTREEGDCLVSMKFRVSLPSPLQLENKELHWKISLTNSKNKIFLKCHNHHIKNLTKTKLLQQRRARTKGSERGNMRLQRAFSLVWCEYWVSSW